MTKVHKTPQSCKVINKDKLSSKKENLSYPLSTTTPMDLNQLVTLKTHKRQPMTMKNISVKRPNEYNSTRQLAIGIIQGGRLLAPYLPSKEYL